MEVTEILDKLIEAMPEKDKGNKNIKFYLSGDLYIRLVNKKKRMVKSYKGYKLKPNGLFPKDYATFTARKPHQY